MQRLSDAVSIFVAVLILGLVGEPIRRMRLMPKLVPKVEPQPKLKAS
jgi:hypothetical protein